MPAQVPLSPRRGGELGEQGWRPIAAPVFDHDELDGLLVGHVAPAGQALLQHVDVVERRDDDGEDRRTRRRSCDGSQRGDRVRQGELIAIERSRMLGEPGAALGIGRQRRGGLGEPRSVGDGHEHSGAARSHTSSVSGPEVVTTGRACDSAAMALVRRLLMPSG